jgi:hypothetical protein
MSDQPEDLWLVDRLLAGDPRVEDASLTSLLAAATAPATSAELGGEDAIVAAFTQASRGISPSTPLPSRARSRPMLSTLLAGKVVAAAAASGIALAGTAAAAYTGNLPDALQDIAHQTIGAPAADLPDAATERPATPAATPTGRPATATPVGPDATGAAAYGLCTAWDKGGLATKSVAYEALVKAAGGDTKIEEFCATVDQPGKAADAATRRPTSTPTARATGAPETHPTSAPSHPTGAPTSHATGAPADVPAPAKPTK